MKKQKEKRYRLTMTEKQLHYMMAAVEDWLRRGTSVIDVPDDWHDGDKVTVRISKKTNENEKEK